MKKMIILALIFVVCFSVSGNAGEVSGIFFVNNSDCSVIISPDQPKDPFSSDMIDVIESVIKSEGVATLLCGRDAVYFDYTYHDPFLTVNTSSTENLIFVNYSGKLFYLDPNGCVLEK